MLDKADEFTPNAYVIIEQPGHTKETGTYVLKTGATQQRNSYDIPLSSTETEMIIERQ